MIDAENLLTADPHAVTVLRATYGGDRLRKSVSGGTVTTPTPPRRYDAETCAARDLAGLAALLSDLDGDPSRCIVRAALSDPTRAVGIRRRTAPDAQTGELPELRDVPRAWCGLDVDGLAAPPGHDPRDLMAAGDAIRAALPDPFRAAGMIVAATAGAGIKPGLRARAWFLLSRPVRGGDLAAWLGGTVPGLDPATLRAAQIHYTARPKIADGPDPVPVRLALLPGPAVTVPDLRFYRRPPPPPEARETGRGGTTGRLAALLRTVGAAPNGKRHPALFWAACRAGEMVAAGELGREDAASALARAVSDPGGKDRHDANLTTARAGIARGFAEAPHHGR